MRTSKSVVLATAVALAAGGAALLAATVASVSVSPDSLTILQGGSGSFAAGVDSITGSVPPRAANAPTVSYCAEWTLHSDGQATCDTPAMFMLERGRNYTQAGVSVGDYAGLVVVNVDADVPCNAVYTITQRFTAATGAGVDFGAYGSEVTRPVSIMVSCRTASPVFDGCSHGYWKNHLADWPATYPVTTQLGTVFNLGPFGSLGGKTLAEALDFRGGSTNLDKAKILLRNAVAGLLNSATPGINYFASTAELIGMVNAALATNNAATMLALEAQLDAANQGSSYCGDSQ